MLDKFNTIYEKRYYAGFGTSYDYNYRLENGKIVKHTYVDGMWRGYHEEPVEISKEEFVKIIRNEEQELITETAKKITELENILKEIENL